MSTTDKGQISKFIEGAVTKAFQVQLSLPVELISLDSAAPLPIANINCISSIALDSPEFDGVLSLAMPSATILRFIEIMVGEAEPALTTENCDASGELANIIYGSARDSMNQAGHNFKLALPTTVIGESLSLAKSKVHSIYIAHHYKTTAGDFLTTFWLKAK